MSVFRRRCTSCGTVDEARTYETYEAADDRGLDWTCAHCGATDTWDIVKEEPRTAS